MSPSHTWYRISKTANYRYAFTSTKLLSMSLLIAVRLKLDHYRALLHTPQYVLKKYKAHMNKNINLACRENTFVSHS